MWHLLSLLVDKLVRPGRYNFAKYLIWTRILISHQQLLLYIYPLMAEGQEIDLVADTSMFTASVE